MGRMTSRAKAAGSGKPPLCKGRCRACEAEGLSFKPDTGKTDDLGIVFSEAPPGWGELSAKPTEGVEYGGLCPKSTPSVFKISLPL